MKLTCFCLRFNEAKYISKGTRNPQRIDIWEILAAGFWLLAAGKKLSTFQEPEASSQKPEAAFRPIN
ncbi:MAG: hypothetical protein CFE21_17370 [Bacteroidetes bacterium B1(2017)]|nr:MAG: hypothetical protein CFE21_17370 [Bacteroidetes bacterium B1(2017)]